MDCVPSLLYAAITGLLLCGTSGLSDISGCSQISFHKRGPDGYPESLKWGYPTVGLSCQAHLCGELTGEQCTDLTYDGEDHDLQGYHCRDTDWFSNEVRGGSESCPEGHFLESIRCTGANCDNPFLRCCKPLSGTVLSHRAVHTKWFTTPSSQKCPAGHVVIALNCKKHYCEDFQLICAPIVPAQGAPPASSNAVPVTYDKSSIVRGVVGLMANSKAKMECWQWMMNVDKSG